MAKPIDPCLQQIDADGFAILHSVFERPYIDVMLADLSSVLQAPSDAAAIRSDAGNICAAV